jgi:hypothetical protein
MLARRTLLLCCIAFDSSAFLSWWHLPSSALHVHSPYAVLSSFRQALTILIRDDFNLSLKFDNLVVFLVLNHVVA